MASICKLSSNCEMASASGRDESSGLPDIVSISGVTEGKSSAISNDEAGICQICLKQLSRYVCPRCNVPYCSSSCYKDVKHADCSESFFKENFLDALKDSDISTEEKRKMGEMLQRLELENAIDSDDDDDDRSEDETSLEDRLKGVDLDADPEMIWERLTEAERLEFSQILKSENLGMLVPSWNPWWTQHDSELIKEVKKEGLLMSEGASPDTSSSIPKIIPSVPNLTDILQKKEPSPLVIYDIINVLYSYTLLMRFYNGEVTEFTVELAENLLAVSKALSQNKNFSTAEEAVHSATENVTTHLKEASSQRLPCLQDVIHILLGKSPSRPLVYVEGALSECWRIVSSAKKCVAKDLSQKSLQKQLLGCKRKLEFHLAWAAKFPDDFKIAAIEVQCLYRTLLEDEELTRKVQSSLEDSKTRHDPLKKPSKLIQEIT